MAADFVVRWADFSGGNFGVLDPAYADKNQYSGQNVLRYNSGLLGPRAGLKQLAVNWGAYPGTHPVLGPYGFDVMDGNLLINLGTRTHRIPVTAPTTSPYNVYAATPTGFVRYAQGNRVLYALVNGDLYKHNEGTCAVTLISLPGGIKLKALTRWGYYLVGVQADLEYRLWHSTVSISGADFDTWGPNNYLDVGSNLPIVTLKPLYNMLFAGKADGWWAISGVLGEQATVRMRNMGNGPRDERQATTTTDNQVLYWGADATPMWFGGETPRIDADYQLAGYTTSFAADTVVATPTGKRLVMIGERLGQSGAVIQSGMLLHDGGKWTTHTFDIPISAVAGNDVRNASAMPAGVIFMCQRPKVINEAISIVSFQCDLDRPAYTTDTWAAPRDQGSTELVTGQVDLPAHWDAQGRYLKVTSVTVQFRKWPSGIAGTRNELRCKVVPFGLYEGGQQNTETKVWTQSSDRADTGGTDDSMRFSFGENPHSIGFQVQFPVMRGVAIREVIVEVEVRTTRG